MMSSPSISQVEDDDYIQNFVDIDRLLVLVQGNPAIYNSSLKEHHNVDIIAKIWNDIGNELNVPGNYYFVILV